MSVCCLVQVVCMPELVSVTTRWKNKISIFINYNNDRCVFIYTYKVVNRGLPWFMFLINLHTYKTLVVLLGWLHPCVPTNPGYGMATLLIYTNLLNIILGTVMLLRSNYIRISLIIHLQGLIFICPSFR